MLFAWFTWPVFPFPACGQLSCLKKREYLNQIWILSGRETTPTKINVLEWAPTSKNYVRPRIFECISSCAFRCSIQKCKMKERLRQLIMETMTMFTVIMILITRMYTPRQIILHVESIIKRKATIHCRIWHCKYCRSRGVRLSHGLKHLPENFVL